MKKAASTELFTARGRFLIQVIDQPGITIEGLTRKLFITKRSVWGIVGELREIGYLVVQKKGRRHYYYITDLALSELRKLTERGKW